MAYSDKVIDHYNNPRNVGSLDKSKSNVGTGVVGAPECGDVMKLQIEVEGDRIVDAKFKTFGCGSAIASSSLATEWIKGKTLDEAMAIKNTQIVEELSLPPVKIHCSVLAEDAIKSAIADLIASSASTLQWILTGGSESSSTIWVFEIWSASSSVLPLIHSVASDELAIAEPQPKVLNLASTMRSPSTWIWSFMTSPHSGAPTTPVPTVGAALSREPTLRGLL